MLFTIASSTPLPRSSFRLFIAVLFSSELLPSAAALTRYPTEEASPSFPTACNTAFLTSVFAPLAAVVIAGSAASSPRSARAPIRNTFSSGDVSGNSFANSSVTPCPFIVRTQLLAVVRTILFSSRRAAITNDTVSCPPTSARPLMAALRIIGVSFLLTNSL